MMSPPAAPPRSICILRLSAIGDTCHVVPIVRTLQQAWPTTQLTWIIGKSEARLMSLIAGVEFITVDKGATLGALRALRRRLRGRRFDVLLHLQLALRASLAASCVPATVKLGFDRARARELQWLFTNARIAPRAREHVLDSFFGFPAALGISERLLRWDLPLPAAARAYAAQLIPDQRATLVINPCSRHPRRNWRPERYAALANHAASRHGMRVILAGGASELERRMGVAIEQACAAPLVNQIGKDTLPELLALLARASVLLSPDSGPVHMATMVGTPVLGLYAATNPARSGPYLSGRWCIDAYPRAAHAFRGCEPRSLPWNHKIEEPGVMDLISVAEVAAKLDELLGSRP
jgi:heptosyltransferase I